MRCASLALAAFFITTQSAHTAPAPKATDSWVGQEVMPKKPHAEIQFKAVANLPFENEDTEELLSVIAGAEGRFDDAIKHQKKALADPDYAEREGHIARQRLKAYEQRKPWRE